MTKFMERLAKLMPKRPDPRLEDGPMIAFKQEPIRRHAEAFAATLQGIPGDEAEFRNALWVFGEMLCGDMEKRLNAALELAADSIKYTPAPHIIVKENP